ncbi:hypothetical protein DENSPDRAFT_830606 [Dentipellis sp. KUC8613]|nr:hypothetical protein DENSPDRAFT_830606 [Dentipellis sp. KUC8613]
MLPSGCGDSSPQTCARYVVIRTCGRGAVRPAASQWPCTTVSYVIRQSGDSSLLAILGCSELGPARNCMMSTQTNDLVDAVQTQVTLMLVAIALLCNASVTPGLSLLQQLMNM